MGKKEQKKKKGAAVQDLIGFKAFTDYGVSTNRGELLIYEIRPTNLSVLSAASVENKIGEMTMLLSAVPGIEIACIDSNECFDENKAYLSEQSRKRTRKSGTSCKKILLFWTASNWKWQRRGSFYLLQGVAG